MGKVAGEGKSASAQHDEFDRYPTRLDVFAGLERPGLMLSRLRGWFGRGARRMPSGHLVHRESKAGEADERADHTRQLVGFVQADGLEIDTHPDRDPDR
jgi:hypothetical protein